LIIIGIVLAFHLRWACILGFRWWDF